MSKPRIRMTFTRLVAGSYQTVTLTGLHLQIMKGGKGWTVSSSTQSEGPFDTLKTAKSIALVWDTAHTIESIGNGFTLDADGPIAGRYRLSLTTLDGELIDVIDLGGDGFPLPVQRLGPSSLAQEINDRLRHWEKANPPAPEVPM